MLCRTRAKHWMVIIGLIALLAGPVYAGGKLLGANVEVTDSGLGSYGEAQNPDVTANGSTVYAVWEDKRPFSTYNAEIYLTKSTDGGAAWGGNVNVSNGLDNEIGLSDPAVAVYPDNWVYVVWFNPYPGYGLDPRVYMASSSDGSSFTRSVLWGSNDDSYYIKPEIAVNPDSRDMLVAVSDWVGSGAGGENIYGLVWDYDAGTWRSHVVNDITGSATSSGGMLDGSRMAVAAQGSASYVAWEDARDGGTRIYGDRTTDHGQTWGADLAISPAGVTAGYPRLALAPDSTLYAAYEANGEIYLLGSANNGASWSTPIQVSSTGDDELGRWDMAVDGNGTVAVLWAAGDWGSWGSSNLYLSTSIDDGQSFTTVGPVEDDQGDYPDIASQYSPAVAATGSGDDARAIMVWHDDRNTVDQIWSARAELDATPPTAPTNLQATPGDTVVSLTWGASSDRNGISGYYVVRATASGGPYTVVNPLLITTTSYRDVGLDTGTYYYQVFAIDGAGNVGYTSNEASAAVTVGSDLPLDGTIAYESGSDVRLNDLPGLGNQRTLAQGTTPVLGPNGNRVYYYHSHTIESQAVSGGDAQTYYTDNHLAESFDLAADVNYFVRVETHTYFGTDPGEWCMAWEPRYGQVNGDDVYADIHAIALEVALSPDRRWLAYAKYGYCTGSALGNYDPPLLCLVDLNSLERTCHGDVGYHDPAFAPGGNTLAFAANFSGQYEIWKATAGTDGSLSNLTQLTRGASGLWSRAPAWSSDDNWLIFHRDTDPGEGESLKLCVVQSDGSKLRALNVSGEEPTWYGTGSAPPVIYDHFIYLSLTLKNY